MNLRNVCLMLVFLSLVLRMVAQNNSDALTTVQPDKSIVLNNTTVALTGPNGSNDGADGGDAPSVLQVVGGVGGNGAARGGVGSANLITAGAGGQGCQQGSCGTGGTGSSVQILAGSGGQARCRGICETFGGEGGSIVLQPGSGGNGFTMPGSPGNVILALPTGGAVGVGNSSPKATLDVAAGGTTLADEWSTRSSRRFKTNIQPLEGALEKVERLQGVFYQRKSDGKHEIGVVAEDVAQVIPEVVARDPKTHEVQGVDYSRLAALLIEAVKSQQDEIQQLKAQIDRLTGNAGGQ